MDCGHLKNFLLALSHRVLQGDPRALQACIDVLQVAAIGASCLRMDIIVRVQKTWLAWSAWKG